MICKVKAAIEKYCMLSGGSVTVGLSGGADSVALLHALTELRELYGIELLAAHVNHLIRGDEAERDEAFVREMCARLGVPLQVKRVDVPALSLERGIGTEECGRQVRYEFFESLCTDKIATAHTLSDSIETALMNLSRGCSLRGLCGIPPVRDKIIRPLILCTGEEVRQYCKNSRLPFVVDSSNLADDYRRNRVRHYVTWELKKLNGAFEENALRCLEAIREDEELLEALANELLESARLKGGYDAQKLSGAKKPILFRALYAILREESGAMPEKKHLEQVAAILCGGGAQVCGGLRCRVAGGVLRFPKNEAEPWSEKASMGENKTPSGTITLIKLSRQEYENLSRKESLSCFDGEKTEGELILRSRLEGDRLTDQRRNNTKTLKKLFCESKIPVESRNRVAVLADGRGVIYVEGFCVDKSRRVDDGSKDIIMIKE